MSALQGEVEMHHTWGQQARRSASRIDAALEWIDRVGTATQDGVCTASQWIGGAVGDIEGPLSKLDLDAATIETVSRRLAESGTTQWTCGMAHGDFFPGNILFGRAPAGDPGRIGIAVLDWALAEFKAPGFFDPLIYELSFSTHSLYRGASLDVESLRQAHALPPFERVRRKWSERGVEIGLGSLARLATLVHVTLRDFHAESGRDRVTRCWAKLLQIETQLAG